LLPPGPEQSSLTMTLRRVCAAEKAHKYATRTTTKLILLFLISTFSL
jgi:hypothetical protein